MKSNLNSNNSVEIRLNGDDQLYSLGRNLIDKFLFFTKMIPNDFYRKLGTWFLMRTFREYRNERIASEMAKTKIHISLYSYFTKSYPVEEISPQVKEKIEPFLQDFLTRYRFLNPDSNKTSSLSIEEIQMVLSQSNPFSSPSVEEIQMDLLGHSNPLIEKQNEVNDQPIESSLSFFEMEVTPTSAVLNNTSLVSREGPSDIAESNTIRSYYDAQILDGGDNNKITEENAMLTRAIVLKIMRIIFDHLKINPIIFSEEVLGDALAVSKFKSADFNNPFYNTNVNQNEQLLNFVERRSAIKSELESWRRELVVNQRKISLENSSLWDQFLLLKNIDFSGFHNKPSMPPLYAIRTKRFKVSQEEMFAQYRPLIISTQKLIYEFFNLKDIDYKVLETKLNIKNHRISSYQTKIFHMTSRLLNEHHKLFYNYFFLLDRKEDSDPEKQNLISLKPFWTDFLEQYDRLYNPNKKPTNGVLSSVAAVPMAFSYSEHSVADQIASDSLQFIEENQNNVFNEKEMEFTPTSSLVFNEATEKYNPAKSPAESGERSDLMKLFARENYQKFPFPNRPLRPTKTKCQNFYKNYQGEFQRFVKEWIIPEIKINLKNVAEEFNIYKERVFTRLQNDLTLFKNAYLYIHEAQIVDWLKQVREAFNECMAAEKLSSFLSRQMDQFILTRDDKLMDYFIDHQNDINLWMNNKKVIPYLSKIISPDIDFSIYFTNDLLNELTDRVCDFIHTQQGHQPPVEIPSRNEKENETQETYIQDTYPSILDFLDPPQKKKNTNERSDDTFRDEMYKKCWNVTRDPLLKCQAQNEENREPPKKQTSQRWRSDGGDYSDDYNDDYDKYMNSILRGQAISSEAPSSKSPNKKKKVTSENIHAMWNTSLPRQAFVPVLPAPMKSANQSNIIDLTNADFSASRNMFLTEAKKHFENKEETFDLNTHRGVFWFLNVREFLSAQEMCKDWQFEEKEDNITITIPLQAKNTMGR